MSSLSLFSRTRDIPDLGGTGLWNFSISQSIPSVVRDSGEPENGQSCWFDLCWGLGRVERVGERVEDYSKKLPQTTRRQRRRQGKGGGRHPPEREELNERERGGKFLTHLSYHVNE